MVIGNLIGAIVLTKVTYDNTKKTGKKINTRQLVRTMEKMRQRGLKQPYLKGSKGFVKFGFD
jgi:hypothetical protein